MKGLAEVARPQTAGLKPAKSRTAAAGRNRTRGKKK